MTIDAAFERLGKSKFRSRFKLTAADRAYIDLVGMATECQLSARVRARAVL